MTLDSAQTLFTFDGGLALELRDAHMPALQHFFDSNPAYFLATDGELPAVDEAFRLHCDALPPEFSCTRKWTIGFIDANHTLTAMAHVFSDFLAPGVWHVNLFIVATELHGRGVGRQCFEALEAWMRANGARFSRLGVVLGNAKAERFWVRCGFIEVRQRHGIVMKSLTQRLRVMMKPLDESGVTEYLSLVERDRPAADAAALA